MSRPKVAVALLLCTVFAVTSSLVAQEKTPTLAGHWTGEVKADMGEMPIDATFAVDGDKVSGGIKTFHGTFKIEKGELQKDGRWKLSFVTEDGAAGNLTGTLKADTFAGDWDFRPNAVGTFALKRAK